VKWCNLLYSLYLTISQERLTHLAILHSHQLYVDEHAAEFWELFRKSSLARRKNGKVGLHLVHLVHIELNCRTVQSNSTVIYVLCAWRYIHFSPVLYPSQACCSCISSMRAASIYGKLVLCTQQLSTSLLEIHTVSVNSATSAYLLLSADLFIR